MCSKSTLRLYYQMLQSNEYFVAFLAAISNFCSFVVLDQVISVIVWNKRTVSKNKSYCLSFSTRLYYIAPLHKFKDMTINNLITMVIHCELCVLRVSARRDLVAILSRIAHKYGNYIDNVVMEFYSIYFCHLYTINEITWNSTGDISRKEQIKCIRCVC